MSPLIVCYTEYQVANLKRFCASTSSTVWTWELCAHSCVFTPLSAIPDMGHYCTGEEGRVVHQILARHWDVRPWQDCWNRRTFGWPRLPYRRLPASLDRFVDHGPRGEQHADSNCAGVISCACVHVWGCVHKCVTCAFSWAGRWKGPLYVGWRMQFIVCAFLFCLHLLPLCACVWFRSLAFKNTS